MNQAEQLEPDFVAKYEILCDAPMSRAGEIFDSMLIRYCNDRKVGTMTDPDDTEAIACMNLMLQKFCQDGFQIKKRDYPFYASWLNTMLARMAYYVEE